tara:strand:- start:2222 stop:3703 length:1482 start_codon:yes stop_codon:yes gene_type:complete
MIKIKTALLSVYDKTGILELAEFLAKNNVEILSSGGTAQHLIKNGIEVTEVSDYTGSPEMFNGRVKTLHPKIHAGILARGEKDRKELEEFGAKKIDLVVVNLYPFSEEVAKNSSEQEIIEKIDIGGPAMLRAAAKNFKHTLAICNPEDYGLIKTNGIDEEDSKDFASEVFIATQQYDLDVACWLSKISEPVEIDLRYGENPHQSADFFVEEECPIDFKRPIQGKQISYNNVVDALSAWSCCVEFEDPTVCIVKHTNPCGVASADDLQKAYDKAFSTDPTSAFGGVIALNKTATEDVIKKMMDNQFIEVLVAPDFDKDAKKILEAKPNIRVLKAQIMNPVTKELKSFSGVHLSQEVDNIDFSEIKLKTVSQEKPDKADLKDMIFALKVAKHVKSNAIVIAKNQMTLGIGAGQMSRVISTQIAFMKAEEEGLDSKNCVLASDAFFPFRDNIDLAAEKGVKHIIQPGGSVKDDEVIKAVDEHKISMTMTGIRHFKH